MGQRTIEGPFLEINSWRASILFPMMSGLGAISSPGNVSQEGNSRARSGASWEILSNSLSSLVPPVSKRIDFPVDLQASTAIRALAESQSSSSRHELPCRRASSKAARPEMWIAVLENPLSETLPDFIKSFREPRWIFSASLRQRFFAATPALNRRRSFFDQFGG